MDDENVITFRPRDGAGSPGLPPLPPSRTAASAPPVIPPMPTSAPTTLAPLPVPTRERRSAADSLAAATPAPGLPPLSDPAPAASSVPATFRSEGLDPAPAPGGPRLGALSLSAVLAVALAALRGAVTVVSDWRQRRMERDAEEAAWREARVKRRAAEEDAAAKLAKVPTSAEFGRKAVADGRKAAAGPAGSPGAVKAPGTAGKDVGKKPAPVSDKPKPSALPDKPKPKPAPAPDAVKPKPKPVDPAKPSGASGKDGSGKDPAAKKPGAAPDKPPAKPSAGVLAPGKGKGTGTSGKGVLERVHDRKTDGKGKGSGVDKASRVKGPRAPGGPAALGDGKGKGPAGDKPGRVKGPRTPGAPGGKAGGPSESGRRRPTKPVKRVPGAKHGTAEAYDTDECRCRRCVRAAKKRTAPSGPSPSSPSSGPSPSAPGGKAGKGGFRERMRKARKSGTGSSSRPGWGPGTPPPPPYPPRPPRGGRRSAEEDLHAATAWTETVITVERVDRPGDATRRARTASATTAVTTGAPGLPRAPEKPAGARPGTTASTTPKEAPMGAPITSVRPAAPAGMSSEHMTEVSLDDVLDHLATIRARCFDTYDDTALLADDARKLRRALEELAHDLAERHNVVGNMTAAAMTRFAESMDVVARKAEEMSGESLGAAESVETAHDEMFNHYKPVQDAAAGAGLTTPSARAHNEE